MTVIENQTFDQERALYESRNVHIKNCRFDGPADGESAFKESCDLKVQDCYFNLRYPFWHDARVEIRNSEMTELCRAALWYSEDVSVQGSRLRGTKALRECKKVTLANCDILSSEFGWSSEGLTVTDTHVEGEYMFLRAKELSFDRFSMQGKYSFQYIENAVFENCTLNTKDAFWHAKNVTVRNSSVTGEYLGWYCENVTFENCRIVGTQPLCYCKNLRLINCEMIDADLSFEKSEVCATLTSAPVSIKNPASGRISIPHATEIIRTDPLAKAEIVVEK